MDEMFEVIKAGPQNAPPEQALYRIQRTYSDGHGGLRVVIEEVEHCRVVWRS